MTPYEAYTNHFSERKALNYHVEALSFGMSTWPSFALAVLVHPD